MSDAKGPARVKPRCKLLGMDGNVFLLVGTVRRALKNAGQIDRAKEFVARAYHAQGYDEVLALVHEFVEVH